MLLSKFIGRSHLRHDALRVVLFFLVLGVIGLINHRKYGISWEAPALRLNGGNAAIYIADKFNLNVIPEYYRQFPPMGENGMADHGVAYDLILVILERFVGLSDSADIYAFRSLMNYLVFMIGTLAIYKMAKRRFNSKNIGLLAAIMFVLSPRIFAAGFYSPSDMIFSSFFALGVNLSIRFIKDSRYSSAVAAGLISGFATDIRLLGVIALPVVSFAYILHNNVQISNLLSKKAKSLAIFILSSFASIILFFPYLWENPILRFVEVFKSLSKYPWGGTNRYFGADILASDLPWHYLPVWIAITTPIFYLILFGFGTIIILKSFVRRTQFTFEMIQDFLFFSFAFLPIVVVAAMNSVVYDTWRHVFFVYTFIILIATLGWTKIAFSRGLGHLSRKFMLFTSFLCLSQILFWMYQNNGKQYLYFNQLAGSDNLQNKWEMDFLGLSNPDAINYLMQIDKRPQISVGIGSFTPFDMSLKVVKPEYRTRLEILPLESQPDYIVNNFRIPDLNLAKFLEGYELEKYYSIDSSRYFEIWKRQNDTE